MKKFLIIFLLILFSYKSFVFAYSSDPKEFVSELVNEAITKLSDKNLTQKKRLSLLKKLL